MEWLHMIDYDNWNRNR